MAEAVIHYCITANIFFQLPDYVFVKPGRLETQWQFLFDFLIVGYAETLEITITHPHDITLNLCIYHVICSPEAANLTTITASDQGNFDPTTDVQLQETVVEYECNELSIFEDGADWIEKINFTCGLDGSWDKPTTLLPCKRNYSQIT